MEDKCVNDRESSDSWENKEQIGHYCHEHSTGVITQAIQKP